MTSISATKEFIIFSRHCVENVFVKVVTTPVCLSLLSKVIKIASFLNKSECSSLTAELNSRRIVYFVSSKGSAPGKYHDPYFEVSVDPTNYLTAKRIANRIRAKALIENRKCPTCKTSSYKVIEKKGWFEKLYYLGTTRVQCNKCKTKYVI